MGEDILISNYEESTKNCLEEIRIWENRKMRKIYIGIISLLTIFILYSCKVKSDNNIDTIEQTVSKSQDYMVEATTGSSSNTCLEAEIEQIKLLAKMLYYSAGS